MTDQELRDLVARLAVNHEKSVAEADRRFARVAERSAEADARIDRIDALLEKSIAEADRRFARVAERSAEAGARIDRIDALLEKSIAEADRRFALADRRFALLEEQFAKTDAQLAKTDAQLAKTDAQLAETDRQLAKTDAQLAKTDKQLAKTDAQLKKLSEMVGGTVNNQGQVAEEFFYRSLSHRPVVGNIQFQWVHRNLGGERGGVQDEFDIVLVNGDTLIMLEVKTKAHLSLVDTMLQRKIPNFHKVLPYFKKYKMYAGIASLVTYKELIEEVKKHGLFLLTQQGNHVEVLNEEVTAF